jgi:RNA polymerase sigma-70 factor, ECF subfamily
MLLHDARKAARLDDAGDLVLLDDQDRSRWDHDQIAEGAALLQRALRRAALLGGSGPYQLQAAIAALHDEATSAPDTDWHQISALYGELARRWPSPVVELNRAVAVAMAEGPVSGLAMLDRRSTVGELGMHHLYHAARADLLARLGRTQEAAHTYRRALELAGTTAERRFLQRRLRALADRPADTGRVDPPPPRGTR